MAPPPLQGHSLHHNFRPMSVVAIRLDGQDAIWYGGRPWLWRLCVRWGPSYPQKKKAHHPHPIFGPCLLWPNGWMNQDATWYRSKPRPRRRCVRWGRSSPLKGTQPPSFRSCPCLLWPKAGWMKVPLGTEVDLGPGHIVLDGVSALREKGTAALSFRPMSVVATFARLSYCPTLVADFCIL